MLQLADFSQIDLVLNGLPSVLLSKLCSLGVQNGSLLLNSLLVFFNLPQLIDDANFCQM